MPLLLCQFLNVDNSRTNLIQSNKNKELDQIRAFLQATAETQI